MLLCYLQGLFERVCFIFPGGAFVHYMMIFCRRLVFATLQYGHVCSNWLISHGEPPCGFVERIDVLSLYIGEDPNGGSFYHKFVH